VDVRWDIALGARAELHFFTGLNFSGMRSTALVFHDGRRQGDEVDGSRIKSYGIIAQHGTRITLATAGAEEGWEDLPWRSVVVLPGTCFTSQKGSPAVQIPDCDGMDKWDATRTIAEGFVGYPEVARLKDGTGWTYGHSRPGMQIKSNVRVIRLDRVG
jgi:hypothetical protein